MKLVTQTEKISIDELKQMSERMFDNMVKGVVDLAKEIMAIDAPMHADQEKFLIEQDSEQKNLWGINLYPEIEREEWIEFDSMINIRPWQNNRTRTVENEKIKQQIIKIVNKLVEK